MRKYIQVKKDHNVYNSFFLLNLTHTYSLITVMVWPQLVFFEAYMELNPH